MVDQAKLIKETADKVMAFYVAASFMPEVADAFNLSADLVEHEDLNTRFLDIQARKFGSYDQGQKEPEIVTGVKAVTNDDLTQLAHDQISFVDDFVGVVSKSFSQSGLKLIWKGTGETSFSTKRCLQAQTKNLAALAI